MDNVSGEQHTYNLFFEDARIQLEVDGVQSVRNQ